MIFRGGNAKDNVHTFPSTSPKFSLATPLYKCISPNLTLHKENFVLTIFIYADGSLESVTNAASNMEFSFR